VAALVLVLLVRLVPVLVLADKYSQEMECMVVASYGSTSATVRTTHPHRLFQLDWASVGKRMTISGFARLNGKWLANSST
jgi:hypothetical protein